MNSMDVLKRKVDDLQKQAEEIEELGMRILEGTELSAFSDNSDHTWNHLHELDYISPLRKVQREAVLKYQQWYSTSLQLIDMYISEWKKEFESCYVNNGWGYNGVMQYLRLNTFSSCTTKEEVISDFRHNLETQLSILLSIPPVVEIKEMGGLRELITADVARTEIEQAEVLLDSGVTTQVSPDPGAASVSKRFHPKHFPMRGYDCLKTPSLLSILYR